MRGPGKHRRPKNTPLARGIAAVGLTGSAALALPLAGAGTAGAATPTAAAPSVAVAKQTIQIAPAAAPAAVKSGPVKYSVVAGDSLSKIAHEHGVRGGWKKLYKDNRRVVGDDPRLIHPGQQLSVAGTATRTAGKTAGKTAAKTTAKAATGTSGAAASAPAKAVQPKAVQAVATSAGSATSAGYTYADNLEGWIRESLDIMAREGIPGTFDGIYRNIMRESSGNPRAINNWDSNAVAGTPSKGLLQVIDPTFSAYHVAGTSFDPYDPVANITAACNYAADRYGSIDNVFGAY
ncbi:LysM peptidoglycan-binding domain-containing protein [Streptomyces sp. SKN60]|uniref:LysM peptidoglycan-binding domain-containing protein n=1 Tax=Streptomyces sp. SKN60 TaxID=2855506 RepID=UPI00224846FA|nr:LysM peptidoglycan-binding domain-containing protein [Streptomyces sp. SKN60]MCX2180613.1 LysM peptidoglycan-binding domain-containing protein [Streptomyces sp. SKN60]